MANLKQDLEEFYFEVDPWGYYSNEDDLRRRKYITALLKIVFGHKPDRLLDIGAGNGFITNTLSEWARETEAIELSDNGAKGLLPSIKRVRKPTGEYDVVIATGVLYEQYDYIQMRDWIDVHASGIVLTSHYSFAGIAHDVFDKPQIFYAEFPYRDGNQVLRVYEW